MILPRVIPCLLLQEAGLVKTIKFKSPKYVGDPINAIKIFNEKRVDELIFLDITASRKNNEPNYILIEQIVSECFMPLCYGGGIKSINQAQKIISIGVEKIAINNAALKNPNIIKELATTLGSQSVVLVVDIKKNIFGQHRVFDSVARKPTKIEPIAYIKTLVEEGVGEVMINNVDADGTQKGYDLELIKTITQSTTVPVIACGGAGNLNDIRAVTKESGATAAAAGSLFVFKGPHRAVLINYPPYKKVVELLK